VADWQRLIDVTMAEVLETARMLGVKLTADHSRGESFYRERLGPVVDAFVKANLAKVLNATWEEKDGGSS
jgi:arginyl-tRNA synthetase